MVDESLSYLLGVIGGDGTIVSSKKQNLVTITDKCREFHDVLRKLILEAFLVNSEIKQDKRNKSWYTIIRCKRVSDLLTKEFGYAIGRGKTYTDRIPKQIFSSSRESILSHIAGWIDSEGSSKIKTFKTKYGTYKYPCITIEVVNKGYLEDLYELSKIIGIQSTKPSVAKRKYRKDQKIRYALCWNGFEKCKSFLSLIKNPEKKKMLINKIIRSSDGRPI